MWESLSISSNPFDNRRRNIGSGSVFPSFDGGNVIWKHAICPTNVWDGPVMFQMEFSAFCKVSWADGNGLGGDVGDTVNSSADIEMGDKPTQSDTIKPEANHPNTRVRYRMVPRDSVKRRV